jgi:hypothetical protein
MDGGAAGLLKGTVSFSKVPSSETPGKFDPNIRLVEKRIGKEIVAMRGIAATSSIIISLQDLAFLIYRIINAR